MLLSLDTADIGELSGLDVDSSDSDNTADEEEAEPQLTEADILPLTHEILPEVIELESDSDWHFHPEIAVLEVIVWEVVALETFILEVVEVVYL